MKLLRDRRNRGRRRAGSRSLLRLLPSSTRSQLNRAGFAAPLLAISLDCGVHFLSAVARHRKQVFSFSELLGCKSDSSSGIFGLARLFIKELRGFEVSVVLRDVALVVQRKCA